MSTRVTLLQILKLALTALIIRLVPTPLHAGDKAYIEIEIDGEMLGKWMEFGSLTEYNPDGKEIYHKRAGFDGTVTEYRFEYDRNGKLIHTKDSDGREAWYEYDRNGNCIYEKDSDGTEAWYEYDRNGNCIYEKDSDGTEAWYEYDRNSKLIHGKYSGGWEWWAEYDRNGNYIHEKYSNGDEVWYKYDRNGKLIHQKSSDGDEWRYEYDKHGNKIRSIRKSKGGKSVITVYILEYYTDSTTVKTKTQYRYEQ